MRPDHDSPAVDVMDLQRTAAQEACAEMGLEPTRTACLGRGEWRAGRGLEPDADHALREFVYDYDGSSS